MERTALYPGSFDPFTNGHLGITERGLKAFDKVVIGIATNSRKESMFTVQERIDMIRHIFKDEPCVQVCSFEGLTVNYAEAIKATVILRGLRAVADFEYEFQMANMNRKLNSSVETLFMMTEAPYFFVSSQNVKEVARFGGDISGIVPPYIGQLVREKLK
jgi:pantetheine-phosphate adenylyltransferase